MPRKHKPGGCSSAEGQEKGIRIFLKLEATHTYSVTQKDGKPQTMTCGETHNLHLRITPNSLPLVSGLHLCLAE